MLNSVSIPDGAWTFQNIGPLTTTFVQPTGCTKDPFVGLVSMSEGFANWAYGTQCVQTIADSCFPTTTATPVTSYNFAEWIGYGEYYSPGLHCPSGWATVGSASRDDDGPSTSSGTSLPTDSPDYPNWRMPQAMLSYGLEPGQSMALCCPSSMTPDAGGACYSTLKDFKPTSGCGVGVYVESISEFVTYSVSTDATTTKTIPYTSEVAEFVTRTDVETHTSALASFTAVSYMAMITLVWHQSDRELDSTATDASAATAAATSTSTSTSTSTPNAAGRVGSRVSWDGINAPLGVSTLAMALGATLVFMA
ncbi:hypothetical protein N7452_000685 [Penicillium brevicompactum]|uniref:Uncharacterized protein n=1 Tax=Penicillium brevicompactum TaxID=5074 RepID=A0A9W9R143_PENBR|nr:hypothetical protein N7452_000685 [Penicillium brevicompactum]